MVFERNSKGISGKFLCVSRVVLEFYVGFKEVQWVFEESFKGVSMMFQGNFKGVKRKIEGCS